LLNVAGLSKSFVQPSGKELSVLQDVKFSVQAHDIMALMGPNGSGKTTLLNLIGGELSPDAGTVTLDGEDILAMKPHRRYRRIGRVHQESYKGLATDLTVSELLVIGEKRGQRLALRRVSPANTIETVRAFSPGISAFLTANLNQPARLMSGGQRQLLCLALAVLGRPKLLLLDEHLASLDEQYCGLADSLLLSFVRSEECAALAVTHGRAWAERQGASIWELQAGRLRARSSPPLHGENGGDPCRR
jgi:putative tryptophan/tyrosine transport system ATP-binding protein